MKNPFTYSGEIEYTGDLENLLHRIIRMDGTLTANQKFTCVQYYPEQIKFISPIRGRLSVRFLCRYEAQQHGFKLFYRTYPTARYYVPAALMLILMIGFLCCSLQSAVFLWGALICALILTVFTIIFSAVRATCIKRFCNTFSE